MSKESDDAYKISAETIDVRFSPKHMWDAALSFAAKQQAERDARIKENLEVINSTFDKSESDKALREIRDIMEGK